MELKKNMARALEWVEQAEYAENCCVGFDGYVDSLFHVVKSRRGPEEYEVYSTISEFAQRAGKAAGKSADLELIPVSRRMGGNAPLMAEAMACLGMKTRCIGAMGFPEVQKEFADSHFEVCSVADSAQSMAFEFTDGKLMFGDVQPLLGLDWEHITRLVGQEQLRQWYETCGLWAMVNWSFLPHSNEILKGLLTDVISWGSTGKLLFLDLADPSGRPREELLELFALMKQLAGRTRVVLSMNENECQQVAAALQISEGTPQGQIAQIQQKLGIWLASVHGLTYAAAAGAEECTIVDTFFQPNPKITTGGGDHFNGGFASALVRGLAPEEALQFGNLVSSCYVTIGRSPSRQDLERFLE